MPKPLLAISPADSPWSGPRPAVSVVILTLNEEINLAQALDSCAWADDVHVLDSGSTDRTQAIALERLGPAGLYVHPFQSFGAQRNWAIDHIPLRHDWVFHLDADERFTPELVREMDAILRTNPPQAGYFVANQMILDGAWIKRASGYPAYQMRLFHKARMRFIDHGHGQREQPLEGRTIGTLHSPYLHYNFSKGMDDWRKRHERYARLEAEQMLAAANSGDLAGLSSLFSPDRTARRRALKRLASRLPFRPTLRQLHMLLVQRAILDGPAGRKYARMMADYERLIAAESRHLRTQIHQRGTETQRGSSGSKN